MSWIKRLLQMFNGEEGEMKQSEPLRTNNNSVRQQRQFTEQNKTEPKKEVEARVLYKYPKGQFKFPLIPDVEIEKKAEPKNVRRSEPRSKTITPVSKEKPVKKEHKPVESTPKPKAPTPNRQPFRRTETPSPIFAFNRPKSDEIEYELNGFIRNVADEAYSKKSEEEPVGIADKVKEEAPIEKEVEVVQWEALSEEAEVVREKALSEEAEVVREKALSEEAEVAREKALSEEAEVAREEALSEEAEVVREKALSEEAEVVREKVLSEEAEVAREEAPIEEVEVVQEEALSEEVEVTREKAPIEEAEQIQEETSAEGDELVQEETLVERNEPVHQTEMNLVEQTQDLATGQEREQTDAKVVFEKATAVEPSGLHEPGTEMEAEQAQEPLLEKQTNSDEKIKEAIEDVPVAATLEAAPERKKRQLPFNVLMLKQDKRKLEEQKNIADTILQKFNPVKTTRTFSSEKETEKNLDKATEKKLEKDTDIKVETEAKALETVQPSQLSNYEFPPLNLLQPPVMIETSREWLHSQELLLNETLKNFNVGARVVNVTQGPAVTRFEVQPEPGVKVNKITNLSDDIKLSLAARDIRIEAPIPGKHTIGIEVPNESSRPVLISEILRTSGFNENTSPLAVALGLDIAGTPVVTDLKKMPHGLIAGATGSGKSVCINTMLVSLLYKAHPDDVKLLLIDPKMVELAPYNQIPHLVSPVITDVKAATASLKWAVEEMERRYELFAHTGVRDISRFNEIALEHKRYSEKLPYIVIVIDELADLMMMSPADVEEAICRIAQKARACGIHLIIATQRPSVDVITGLIKANVPTRVAFSVSSQVDSRTIIDISGAEKLLGRGDMLFLENGSSKPFRLQGTFVSDQEIDDIVAFVRKQRDPEYLFEQDELIKKSQITEDEDELFYEACLFVIEQGGASTSSIQRRFKIGYNRAARLIDMMEQNGFISEGRGSKPRDVLISVEDLDFFQENHSLT
ncbi:DNA translocase FtsK [Mesobacillus maritimus]|uniref:DNA translocase FtsK n=1 Tax=Mesobacillus maritimus TaxID=1643336 RepID=UPI00384B95AC